MLKQAVFLVGGLGTRLGARTQNTPKPMLKVAGRPFIDYLIDEAARHGFTDIVLLSGYLGEQVTRDYDGLQRRGARIRVLKEPERMGTGGALRFALPHLDDYFLLANGDTFFDINLRALARPDVLVCGGAVMALRNAEGARYGRVRLADGRVTSFHRPEEGVAGPINGGIYALSRDLIAAIGPGEVSLEGAIFPPLAAAGLIRGEVFDGYFIDIGIEEDFQRADRDMPARIRRPAIFFDRDGVLNVEKNYLYRWEDFEWMTGAREAIRLANDAGWFVFVVTNQAGVARGYYGEADVRALHNFMQQELAAVGAHIDAFEYCPHHPDGIDQAYRQACDRRKPGPGMIRDLLKAWPVNTARSLLVGDMPHDVAAAEAAGIDGYLFSAGDLRETVLSHVRAAER